MSDQHIPSPNPTASSDATARSQEPTQGATTLLEILGELRTLGFGAQFIAKDGATVDCVSCRAQADLHEFSVAGFRRIEGASDAADMNIVVWGRCPSCNDGGTLILGYGPNASAADAGVLDQLSLDDSATPGATPREAAE